nr:hypothetical protein [Catenulispora acidiphila]
MPDRIAGNLVDDIGSKLKHRQPTTLSKLLKLTSGSRRRNPQPLHQNAARQGDQHPNIGVSLGIIEQILQATDGRGQATDAGGGDAGTGSGGGRSG